MSYLAFHLVFILPPLVLLALALRGRLRAVHPRAGLFLAGIALIALVYTTPWDNYLVWRGVWSYGADRVLGTIGYVPVEEYLFFVLQPLGVGLWLYARIARNGAARRVRGGGGSGSPDGPPARQAAPRVAGALAYLLLSALGIWLLFRPWGTYLGLILAWAGPVLALQWAWAGGEIWARRRLWAVGFAVPTVYLWMADAVAIRLGIWSIAERFTTGIVALGLPLEEAVFFLATTLLVVQGLMLFLYPPHAPSPPRARQPSRAREGTLDAGAPAPGAGRTGAA